jgi:hypothetical protein
MKEAYWSSELAQDSAKLKSQKNEDSTQGYHSSPCTNMLGVIG